MEKGQEGSRYARVPFPAKTVKPQILTIDQPDEVKYNS